ncbi:S28 family serine protease [Streptomyces sp. NPDC051907]|uniref:S28 family serine protease n=1 Tax=Streptomyces sp. NPDC051907 TaxID=3155284 RepID=UPI003443F5D2
MRTRRIAALLGAGLLTAAAQLACSPPATAAPAPQDVREQLERIPGMTVVSAAEREGSPYYTLSYRQPVDHADPAQGTFAQRLTLWHKVADGPTVLYTGGYVLDSGPTQLTRLLGANQVSVEHRYFGQSRPTGAARDDWSRLTVWQEASDEHRLTRALRSIERGRWLGTGVSKGGMTATYHERYYPDDLDAVVAFVAPNDADHRGDSGYERFFATVGTARCRAALNAVQREMLLRRAALLPRFADDAATTGARFEQTLGTADRAYEFAVLDQVWNFWQSGDAADCTGVPDARAASDDALYTWSKAHGLRLYRDQTLGEHGTGPYYRQAATQLGWADLAFAHLRDVRRHQDLYQPNSLLPAAMRGSYDPTAIADVDRWVRTRGERMMFVYGQNDPWSAEQFTPSRHDSHRFVAPGANHTASLASLPAGRRGQAVATIKRWAAVKD